MWPSLLIFLFVLGNVRSEEDVAVLTALNFSQVISENDYVLVEFYAPWCGHCQALEPEYNKAAAVLKENGSNVKLAKVDATVEKNLATEHQITGYPTLKLFRRGVPISYDGQRQAQSIVDWCTRKTEAPLKKLTTVSEAKDFMKSGRVVVVGFFKDEDSPHIKDLNTVAESLDRYPFGVVSSAELFKEYGVSGDAQVVLFKQFDDGRSDHHGELTEWELKKFIQSESIPLVVDFSQDAASEVFSSPTKTHLVSFMSKKSGVDDKMRELEGAAKLYKGKAHVIVIDTDVEDHQRILEFFGMTTADIPSYRVINLGATMVKYKPSAAEFTTSSIAAFLDDVLIGKQKPFYMSQDIPEKQEGPVVVLVGNNYNEVTSDKSKAVFAELYAPWCNHCKQLIPIWDKVAEHFKDSKDIVIAKMDATANEAENLKIQMFPTLKYYPKDSDEVIDYNGDRTFEALVKFVESGGKDITQSKQETPEEEEEEEEPKDEL